MKGNVNMVQRKLKSQAAADAASWGIEMLP